MSERDPRLRVADMLDAARDAIGFIRGCSREDLDTNRMVLYALARAIEILGEAARNVEPGVRARHPEVPWRDISGMRNRIVHAYFDLDPDIVWSIVTKDLPVLVRQLEAILGELPA